MRTSILEVLPFSYRDNGKNFDFIKRIEEMCGDLRKAGLLLTNPRFDKVFSREYFSIAFEEQVRIYHLGLSQTSRFGSELNQEKRDKYFADVAQSVFEGLTHHKVHFNLNAFRLFLSLLRRKYTSEYGRG